MIKILDATKNPITAIGTAAAVCYDSISVNDIVNGEKPKRAKGIGKHCLNSGHTRTAEFAKVKMIIDGYSARVIRELYTHVIGTSKVQASTRYIKYDGEKFGYYIPDAVRKNEYALNMYEDIMDEILIAYRQLIELGVKQEDAGNILPLGHETTIAYEINVRALMHLFNVRTCNRAYKEFRDFMEELREELCKIDEEWKELCDNYFVTKCEFYGFCDEGNCCGRKPRKEDVMELINDNIKSLREKEKARRLEKENKKK